MNEKLNATNDEDYFQYELLEDEKSYSIGAKNVNNLPKYITLPKEYNNLPITTIQKAGFSNCKNLKKIVIPNSIVNIESGGAFSGCINLLVVDFEEDSLLKRIGINSFKNCSELQSIILPENLKVIGDGAFYNCAKLDEIYITAKNLIVLGKDVLCKTSESMNIHVKKNSICEYKNSKGWSIYKDSIYRLPQNIPSNLGHFIFLLNEDNESYTICDIVYDTDNESYEEKIIKFLTLPRHLVMPSYYKKKPITVIGKAAFWGNTYNATGTHLLSIILPKHLKIIRNMALAWNTNVKEFIMPDSLETIERSAIGGNTRWWDRYDCYQPSLLEKIVFSENSKLKSIGSHTMAFFTKMKEFTIPKSTTNIDALAFWGCALSHINIPAKVEHIENNIFAYSRKLKEITVDEKNRYFKDVDGVLYNKEGNTLVSYPLAKEDDRFTIDETIENISTNRLFFGAENLRILYSYTINPTNVDDYTFDVQLRGLRIYVPKDKVETYKSTGGWSIVSNSIYENDIIENDFAIKDNMLVQYLGNDEDLYLKDDIKGITNFALSSSKNLKNIYVSDDNPYLKSIDGVLFNKNLTTLIAYPQGRLSEEYEIPSSVKKVGFAAFLDCKNLRKIYTHENLRKLDSYAFYRCKNLINIINKDNKDNIQILGDSCFMYCDSIKKVYFEKVKKIEKNCFFDCRSLEEIHLDSVKFIGETAIYRSSTIKKINLGKELKYIDRYGVSPRENSQIFINAIVPPVYEEGLFCYFDYYVPSESVELYKKAPTWSVCSNRIYPLTKNLIE